MRDVIADGQALKGFDELMLWADRPAYPCSIFFQARFSGRFDRGALDTALRAVMPAHPMLGSLVDTGARRPVWRVQPGAIPAVEWRSGPAGRLLPAAPRQNLEHEIGLRLYVVESAQASELTLQVHHACCDGIGIAEFLGDLLAAYAQAKGGPAGLAGPPRRNPGLLARRGAYGLTIPGLVRLLPRQIAGLKGTLEFLARSPSPLLPNCPVSDADAPAPEFPAVHILVFTPEEVGAFRHAARRFAVTLNDLLARDAFVALGEWRFRQGALDDHWLRMMIPMNLRVPTDDGMPAANLVGAVFLDRRRSDFANPARLLEGLAREMRRIKRNRLGLIFILGLRLARWVPGVLRRQIRRNRCFTTTVFSNLGRIRLPLPVEGGRYVAGGLALDQAMFTAPLIPYSCVAFTAVEYGGALTVALHYDPRAVSAAQAGELAGIFVRQVRATARPND